MCGLGLPLDYLKAYMWFELAVAHSTGHDQVLNRHLRDVVAAMQLTPEQIAEAERLARNWKPQKPPGSNSPRPA
jgi:TPR repeat protein